MATMGNKTEAKRQSDDFNKITVISNGNESQ